MIQEISDKKYISEGKSLQQLLDRITSIDRLEDIFHAVTDGVTVQDKTGRVIFANLAAAKLLGFESTEQFLSTPMSEIWNSVEMTDEQGESFLIDDLPGRRALRGLRTDSVIVKWANKKENTIRWSEISAGPVYGDDGEILFAVNVMHDITNRKHDEVSRAASSKLSLDILSSISARVPGMIVVYNLYTGRYIYVNEASTKILGYDPEDFLNRGTAFAMSLIHPDDAEMIMQKNMEALRVANDPNRRPDADQLVEHFEYRMRHKDGSWRWLHSYGGVFDRNNEGLVEHVMNISVDITHRKETEDKLKSLHEELEQKVLDRTRQLALLNEKTSGILASISDAFVAFDRDWRYTYVNEKALEMMGKSREELIGKVAWEVFPESMGNDFYIKAHEVVATQIPVKMERYSDRMRRWVAMNLYPSIDGLSVTYTDITSRKLSEEALARSERRFRTLINNSSDAIALIDEQAKILYMSPTSERILGYLPAELVGTKGLDLVHPEDMPKVQEVLAQTIRTPGVPVSVEFRIKTKDGSYRWVESVTNNLLSDPEMGAIVSNFRDITERRIAAEALKLSERRFALFMENLPGLAWIKDTQGRYVYINDEAETAFQISRAQLVNKTDDEVFSAETAEQFKKNDQKVLDTASRIQIIEVLQQKDGIHHSVVSKFPIFGRNGEPALIGGVAIDISDRLHAEQALKESLARYSALVSAISAVMWISDIKGNFRERQPSWEEFTGQTLEQYQDWGWLNAVHPEDRDQVKVIWTRALEAKNIFEFSGRLWHSASNSYHYFEARAVPIIQSGRVHEWIGTVTDVHDRELADQQMRMVREKMEYTFHHDSLTDLPNRFMFNEILANELKRVQTAGGMLALMVIDLDRFKMINESLGHAIGDRLIQEVSLRLVSCMNESYTLARLGGDEFGILMSDIEREEEVGSLCQKIIDCLKHPFHLDNNELYITPSMGITLYPYDGADPATLLKNADSALYRAKEQGRNNFQFYNPSMNATSFQQLTLENTLRRALKNQEFVVYYQPQIDVQSGKIVEVEALLRWKHPDLGLTFPDEFIKLAEVTGLIEPIGEWVLRAALTQVGAWQKAGYDITVAVNLSARQFKQRHLVRSIRRIISETNYDAKRLEFELTESVLVDNSATVFNTLNELKKDGVLFAIDDFNTGYSSLNYVKRFPIDILKIDKSFVKGLPSKDKDSAIANSIINLAHSLNMIVVAEGVERTEQFNFLRERNCDKAQGYLFSPPVDAETLTHLLSKSFKK